MELFSKNSHKCTSRRKRVSNIGAMGEFDQNEDTFSVYLDELEHYVIENGQKQDTVEPRFNEVAGDLPNLSLKSKVRYIENLDITNLRGNDKNVRYIEVIVNDWFATQVTSVKQFLSPRSAAFWDAIHWARWLSVAIIFSFEQTRSFCVQKNDTFRVAILKCCIQTVKKLIELIRDKEDRAEVNWCRNTIVPMSMTYNKPFTERLLSLYHKD